MSPSGVIDTAEANYRQERLAHWDSVAVKRDSWRGWGAGYHSRLLEIYRFLVSPGLRVLEIGCGEGDLLAGLRPSRALGIDFSGEMLKRGRQKHPDVEFIQADAHDLSSIEEQFDVIILSDAVNDLWDVQAVFQQIRRLCTPSSRVLMNFHSGLWQLPLAVAQWLNLAAPDAAPELVDARSMPVECCAWPGFETIRVWHEILWPFGYGGLFNRFVVRFWPFNQLALANFMTARLQPQPIAEQPSVSVIIPARNESGNVRSDF